MFQNHLFVKLYFNVWEYNKMQSIIGVVADSSWTVFFKPHDEMRPTDVITSVQFYETK